MASAHRFGKDAFDWTLSSAVVPDPGDAGTIDLQNQSHVVCELTIAGTETRSLPTVTSLKSGIHLYVVANQITSGSCTVDTVILDSEGDIAHFVTAQVNGAVAWVTFGGDSATASIKTITATNQIRLNVGGDDILTFDDSALGSTAGATEDGADGFITGQNGGQASADADGQIGGSVGLVGGAGSDGGAHTSNDPDGGAGGSVSLVPGRGGDAGDGGSGVAGADGVIRLEATVFHEQGAPAAVTTTATLTAAQLLGGLITVTHSAGATQTYTLPTGALLDAAIPGDVGTNEAFEWSLINLSGTPGTNTATVAAGTGHTVVGVVVSTSDATSMRFLTRRTAADTWVTYRIA